MKKRMMFVAAAGLFVGLVGCDTPAKLISVPAENVDNTPLKVQALTEEQEKSWGAKDLVMDTIPGMSVDKTYDELINGKGSQVIVAVVDSGVDINHEDLDGVIWKNPKEIPNNGKDDDRNGYIDDVHGWNFLGDIVSEQLEYARIIQKYEDRYKGRSIDQVPQKERATFLLYKKAREEYDTEYNELIQSKTQYDQILQVVEEGHAIFSQKLGKEDYTTEELSKVDVGPDQKLNAYKQALTQMLEYADTVPEFLELLNKELDNINSRLNSNLSLDANFRSVVGDDPYDIKDVKYGDNNVVGQNPEDADHGTHVAGIIAAERNNGIGINGVANNVKIMAIRAVPDGDERDKDIALAIRYAVDNGAKVINGSFGKYFATNPEWVYEAIKYAAKKDVLIVIAAGNESYDMDSGEKTVYPNDQLADNIEFADNVITVGAIGPRYGGEMIAPFSNYGKLNVDVFAPGVQIYSTTPNDSYAFHGGTSMAAPAVSGVAAMLRSYYPQFSAAQIKQIIMQSGTTTNTLVTLGGDPENTRKFAEISKSGKMVNMYNAFKMAELSSKNQ